MKKVKAFLEFSRSKAGLPAFLVLILLASTACMRERIEGNYDLISETRGSSSFTGVVSKGNFRVYIIPGDVPAVEVKGESNVLPYVETFVSGNRLVVEFRNGYNIREHFTVEVYITTPGLSSIHLSGSGHLESGTFVCEHADIELSGSGSIECGFIAESIEAAVSGSGIMSVGGQAGIGYLRVSGSGEIRAPGCDLLNCDANISGSGNVIVSVADALEAWISGSGCVYYIGNPGVISHISGSGKVIRY